MSLSCLQSVKRKPDNTLSRPPSLPMAVFAGFTGDRSGSMMSMADQAADGLYEFIKSNASNAINNGQQGFISATTFDDNAIVRLDNVKAEDVEISARECREWMKPDGCTRLYDTAIEDLARLQRREREWRANLPEHIKALNPKTTIVWSLMTDGFNNASQFTAEDFRNAVQKARKNGVICYFLAANQDACATGERYGFAAEQSITFDSTPDTCSQAMRAVTTSALRCASGYSNVNFTQVMRQRSAPASFDAAVNDDYDSDDDNIPLPPQPYRAHLRQPAQSRLGGLPPRILRMTRGGPLATPPIPSQIMNNRIMKRS